MERTGLARYLPWGKASSNGVGLAEPSPPPSNSHEKKSSVDVDWVGDLSAGRVVYVNAAIPGDVEAVRRSTAYAAAAYLYVAIRYRAENVAEPPLRVAQETDDGDEFVDHDIDELLADPSPDFDLNELIELTQTYWDIYGDALWTKDANLAGQTARLQPWRGDEYDVETAGGRMLGRFLVKTRIGEKPFDPEDVVYLRYPNPSDRHRGLSPTDVALSTLNLGKRTTATIKGLLSNAMFPSIVISTHPEWNPDPEEFQRFKDLIDQFHTGPQNAGKPFVTLGGGKAERVAFTLQELVPEKLLDRVETIVSSVFRIPPIVLGHLVGLANSPWSQMEQAHRQAYSDAIEPLWRRWERGLTRQLLRPIDRDPTLRLAFDTSKVSALAENVSQKITDAKDATHWTVNERRIYTGQAPLPDGDPRGDFIELTDAVSASPLPVPEKSESKAAPHDHSWKWARFDLMAKAQESTWEDGVYAGLKVDRDAVLEGIGSKEFARAWAAALPAEPKAEETKAPPTGDPGKIAALIAILGKKLDPERWRDRIMPLVESTARTALKELSIDLGVAFDVLEPTLLPYTDAEAGWLITKIDETTRSRIVTDLAAGLAEGESIPDLRKRIQDSAAFSRKRAELVARTETTRVTNGAQRQSMSDYQLTSPDQTVEKRWLATNDARTREEHASLDDGKWIGIDEVFANGRTEPGEPRCRCTLLYRITED